MSSSNPDPDPTESTGLEPGGGVPPGETPPDSGSVAGGEHQPVGSGKRSVAAPMVGIGLALLVVLAILVFFAARAADLLG
ncbi:MAG: DUF6480 family protein [Nocardioidaceae bacterium]